MINADMKSCGVCKYATIDFSNKAKVTIYCDLREKNYIYGMCVQCDGPEKVKDDKQ